MKKIAQNPYRIIGVLAGSSARELQRQKSKISAYTKANKQITSEYDLGNLGKPITRNEQVLNKAFSDIEQNKDKIHYALFWLVNVSPLDNMAIEYIKEGQVSKAFWIWEKVTQNKKVGANNFSAFNNIGTLQLLGNNAQSVQQGITAKIRLIYSDFFEDFVRAVSDETAKVDPDTEMQRFVNAIITSYPKTTPKTFLRLFEHCGDNVRAHLLKSFTETPIRNIELAIEKAKERRREHKSAAYQAGLDLYHHTKEDLLSLQSLLSTDNLKYKMWADKLARKLKQCSVDYFNWSQQNNASQDYLHDALKLVQLAKTIAVGDLVKDEIQDAINTLEEMKDRAIDMAIGLLEEIKKTYTKAAVFLRIQGRNITERGINNLLNWNYIVELIQEMIPQEMIPQIKGTQDANKLARYKELVMFALDKMNPSYRNQVQYLKCWETATRRKVVASSTRPSPSNVAGTPIKPKGTQEENEQGASEVLWVFLSIVIIIWIIIARNC